MTAGIILAAGESRRMGRPKALLPLRGGTFLSVLTQTLREFCEPLIAVFGAAPEPLLQDVPSGVISIVNPNWQQGMLTSLQAGLRALPQSCDSVLFTLVDHPAVQRASVEKLLAANSPIAIPRCDGRRGHPVILKRELFEEIANEPSSSQVRDIVNRHSDEIVYIEVADPGIFDDIDDPRLYQSLLEREAGIDR